MVNKEPIYVTFVKTPKVWLWAIGKRTGQANSFSQIERIAKREGRIIKK